LKRNEAEQTRLSLRITLHELRGDAVQDYGHGRNKSRAIDAREEYERELREPNYGLRHQQPMPIVDLSQQEWRG